MIIGAAIGKHNPNAYADTFQRGTVEGAKTGKITEGDAIAASLSIEAEALSGKVGPMIRSYNPQGKLKLLQEL